jgi:hypothetical protein
MNTPRILLAAASVAFLSTAAFATAAFAQVPSADQVSVPPSGESKMHHGKMAALFTTQDEFMMFHIQLHEATRGMAKDQKRAYRKTELQKLKAMTGQQRIAYMQGLDAQWAALSPDRKAHIERHIENHQARRAQGTQGAAQNGGQQPMGSPQ